MSRNTKWIGKDVIVGKSRGIAARYHNRVGTIVGLAAPTAQGTPRFEVSMGVRRIAPLTVNERFLTFL